MSRTNAFITVAFLALVVLGTSFVIVMRREATRTREEQPAQLRAALTTIRGAIAQYRAKHGRGPATLDDLVREKLIAAVPEDPLTGSAATWRTTVEQDVRVDDFTAASPPPPGGGIVNVHSAAPGSDPSGKAWSDY